jgi:VanZ family protein
VTRGRRAALWVPVGLYLILIFALSSQPNPPVPQEMSDKQWHSLGYGGLAVLVSRALEGGLRKGVGLRSAAAAVAISVVYAASDEWHQSFVPGRSADVRDWYADGIGALVGAGACWAWGIIRSRADV